MSEEKKDTTEIESAKKPHLRFIRGLPFTDSPGFIPSNVEDAMDLKPDDTDIFVVTYPKCGTTWTQYMLWEILHKGAEPPTPNQMVFRDSPFLEVTGTEILKDLSPPRTIKTHLPFNLNPYNPITKYIYVVRNPWDCCVSYYHHHKMLPDFPQLTFDEFFEMFITGEVHNGDFFDHVLSWFEHRNDPNVLFLTYENMKKDKRKALLSIAKFLGDSFLEDLKDEDILSNCLKYTDFNYMKQLGVFFPKEKSDDVKENMKKMGNIDRRKINIENYIEANFFRKGEVGDWKNHFSPSQIKKFNQYMLRKLKNTEMENFWQPLLEETAL